MGLGGKPFTPESDERKLWSQADREEEKIAKQSKVWDDPLLEEYLARVGDRLMPAEVKAAGGRDLEREEDAGGMDKLVKAGYDPREAPKVFSCAA
jgi:predicted Zn-dependent protease